MRHFSELSEEEINGLWQHYVEAAIEYSKQLDVSGLSHNGVHNIYLALEDAITGEWEKSKKAMNK